MNRQLDFAPTVMDLGLPATQPVPPRTPAGATLREVLTHVFYDGKRIRAVLLLGLLLTALATYMAPKRYVAEAALLLRLGREYIYTPEVGDTVPGAPVAYDREQTLLAESRILTSQDTLEAALDKLDVAQLYPAIAQGGGDAVSQRTQALLAMEKSLSAELLKGSNLLQISFKHDDAPMSAQVLVQVIDAYLAKRAAVFNSSTLVSTEAEFKQRKQELDKAEAAMSRYKGQNGIRSFAEEQSLLLAQRNLIEQRQADSALALAQATGRVAALRANLSTMQGDVTLSSETQRSEAADHARKLLLDLRLKERDLAAKFADDNLLVMDVRTDINRTSQYLKEMEAKPNRAVRSGRSPARDVGESELMRTLADERQASAGTATLQAQRLAVDKRLAELAGNENEMRTLERDRRLAEVNYEAAAKRLRDESAMAELDRKRRSSVSVVQAPRVPLQANSLRPVVLVVGVFLSLCAALLVAFLSALWRDTYLLPEQLQRDLDVPLLAAIPRAGP